MNACSLAVGAAIGVAAFVAGCSGGGVPPASPDATAPALGTNAATTPSGVIDATAAGPACPSPDRDLRSVSVGYNVNALFWEGLYGDAALVEAVRGLGAPVLRYPGGTESDYWHWTNGRPVDSCRYGPCRTWDAATLQEPDLYRRFAGFSEGTPARFAALATATGGSTLLVANMVTASAREASDWIRSVSDAGLPATRVELGNEPYFSRVEGTSNNGTLFPDATGHVTAARALAGELRAVLPPSVRLAQPAFVPRVDATSGAISPENDERMLSWNDRIMSSGAADYADAFALHFHPRLPARSGATDTDYLARLCGFVAQFWRSTRETPQWKLLPASRRIWVTEFNFSFAEAGEVAGTWAYGLYMAQFAVRALEDARVDLLVAHMLTGNPAWQSVVHPGRAPDVPAAPGFTAYAPTASGLVLTELAAALKGGDCGRPIEPLDFRRAANTDRLAGFVVTRGGSERLLIVNADSVSAQVDMARFGWSAGRGRVLSASPLSRVTRRETVSVSPVTATGGVADAPPYSLLVLSKMAP